MDHRTGASSERDSDAASTSQATALSQHFADLPSSAFTTKHPRQSDHRSSTESSEYDGMPLPSYSLDGLPDNVPTWPDNDADITFATDLIDSPPRRRSRLPAGSESHLETDPGSESESDTEDESEDDSGQSDDHVNPNRALLARHTNSLTLALFLPPETQSRNPAKASDGEKRAHTDQAADGNGSESPPLPPPTLRRKLALLFSSMTINLALPFVNGVMLGTGEAIAMTIGVPLVLAVGNRAWVAWEKYILGPHY